MMQKELFGVFGDREAFERLRSPDEFARVVEGATVTVGVRDTALGLPNRSDVFESASGFCALFGEVYPPSSVANAAEWVYERYAEDGPAALADLNGSYLVALEYDGKSLVAADAIRSWECFFTDAAGVRTFGTDATAVAHAIPDPTLLPERTLEFLLLGCVLNDRTTLAELHRVPIDHGLTAAETVDLRRLVYRPEEFDYAGELARRLRRAIERRAHQPGRKGILLSAGYDSRTILSMVPSIAEGYTVGTPDADEVRVARQLAEKYGVGHRTLAVDESHFNVDLDAIRYTNGIKESIHIHHAGYESLMDADSMYHGLLWDTLLRGYFLPEDGFDLYGVRVPRPRLDPDPDPNTHLARVMGFDFAAAEKIVAESPYTEATTVTEYLDQTVGPRFDECRVRTDNVYDAMELYGLQNVLSTPFRVHLADQYVESLIAADAELIDWHLKTPPEFRNRWTFMRAIRRLDSDLLQPRPPDRPHDSFYLNAVEGFLRRCVPGLKPFGSAWPNRQTLYERHRMDFRLLSDHPELHHLPPRLKLRVNDLAVWLDAVASSQENPLDAVAGLVVV